MLQIFDTFCVRNFSMTFRKIDLTDQILRFMIQSPLQNQYAFLSKISIFGTNKLTANKLSMTQDDPGILK